MADLCILMKEALIEANKALQLKEVPVGCIITRDGCIIGKGYNQRETGKNALYHAEILAINMACENIKDWRLTNCDMFVTLEPCIMCAGAIINSRISRLYFGAWDTKNGAAGSFSNVFNNMNMNHKVDVYGGIMIDECSQILNEFFKSLR